MNEKDLTHLKELLLKARREILDRLDGFQSDWQALSERDLELEEEAQKMVLLNLSKQLEVRERKELDNISLALKKMADGTYGICEECRKPLALARLEILPAAHFCRKCAWEIEEKQRKPIFS